MIKANYSHNATHRVSVPTVFTVIPGIIVCVSLMLDTSVMQMEYLFLYTEAPSSRLRRILMKSSLPSK